MKEKKEIKNLERSIWRRVFNCQVYNCKSRDDSEDDEENNKQKKFKSTLFANTNKVRFQSLVYIERDNQEFKVKK